MMVFIRNAMVMNMLFAYIGVFLPLLPICFIAYPLEKIFFTVTLNTIAKTCGVPDE